MSDGTAGNPDGTAAPDRLDSPRPPVNESEQLVPNSDYASVLSSLLNASTEYGIVATHLDGTFLLWNAGARRIYGYAASEIMGQNVRLLHRREDVTSGKVEEIFEAALRDGVWEGVVTRVRKNGETFAARITVSARRDRSGRPVGYLSISKDITEELRLEQRLRDSESYNRGLIESAIDGLLITDLEGRITDVNKEMELLSGTSREVLIGGRLHELIVPRSAATDVFERLRADGRVKNFELKLRQASGGVVDVSCSATTLVDGKRHAYGVIAALHDIADAKRLQEQLELRNRELEVQNERVREADRMKSDFLARMSHELRTPLNSIIGFSDFLLTSEDATLSADQREYVTTILNSGNHLLSLINDVLDLAKVESGKIVLYSVPFVLAEAIDEVCSSLRLQLQEHELGLRVEVSPALGRISLDHLRFKQILYNLLSNAVKFTPKGGQVQIAAVPEGDARFALRVRDTGIGIPPDDIPRIFREFEQVSAAGPGTTSAGIGLGLPVTQKLVDLMGGSITVQSEVGVGSTFTVRLPWVRPTLAASGAPSAGMAV